MTEVALVPDSSAEVHECPFLHTRRHLHDERLVLSLEGIERLVQVLPGRPRHSVRAAEAVGSHTEVVDEPGNTDGASTVSFLPEIEPECQQDREGHVCQNDAVLPFAILIEVLEFYQFVGGTTLVLAEITNPLEVELAHPVDRSDRVRELLSNSYAESTRKAYSILFRQFVKWCNENGYRSLPADERTLEEYIAHYSLDHAPGTVRRALNAIKCIHREAELSSPTDGKNVRNIMRGLARANRSRSTRQAKGLDKAAVSAIRVTAAIPRVSRGGKMESKEQAARRGLVDVALCSVMFDGLLRRGEAVNIHWRDVSYNEDSETGTLYIPYSKTDQEGEGAFQFLSSDTMRALEAIRPTPPDENARVFKMNGETASRRIRNAAKAAGLEGRYSGHSCRVGMATELARLKYPLQSIMQSGRWLSHSMPARYIRRTEATQSAVASYYAE